MAAPAGSSPALHTNAPIAQPVGGACLRHRTVLVRIQLGAPSFRLASPCFRRAPHPYRSTWLRASSASSRDRDIRTRHAERPSRGARLAACSSARVERPPWKREAVGSNPATQTNPTLRNTALAWFNGRTSDCVSEDVGSTPTASFSFRAFTASPSFAVEARRKPEPAFSPQRTRSVRR